MTALSVLQRYFGYDQFRSGQDIIINSVLEGHHTVALIPTGGGKSLCFQVPGLVLGGVTLVVSPLISLMEDQVQALVRKGVSATWISSSLPDSERKKRLHEIKDQKYQFVYCSPERLQLPSFQKLCSELPIKLVAIDEAHCLSLWGNEFRPEYNEIQRFVQHLPVPPRQIALTATATAQVVKDIINSLCFTSPHVFRSQLQRKNVQLAVHKVTASNQLLQLLKIIQYWHQSSGIVYTLTRKSAELLSTKINFYLPWIKQDFYHGGMEASKRTSVQHQFISGELNLVIATNAFGMGIDKADIRYVIHYQPSLSIENYSQEFGRAGRDGKLSWGYLLFEPNSAKQLHQQFLEKMSPNTKRIAKHQSEAMLNLLNSSRCLQTQLSHYFSQLPKKKYCQKCSSCVPVSLPQRASHQKLYQELQQLTSTLSKRSNLRPELIANTLQLEWFSLLRPTKASDFVKIPGVGYGWLTHWFTPYSGIISRYVQSHQFKKKSNDAHRTSG